MNPKPVILEPRTHLLATLGGYRAGGAPVDVDALAASLPDDFGEVTL